MSKAAIRSDWYIDAVNGNDANSGRAADDALQTHAELVQRMMGESLALDLSGVVVDNGGIPAHVSCVHILSDLPASDPIELGAALQAQGGIFVYQGKTATTRSSTLGFTPQNRGTNSPCAVSDSPYAWTAGQRIRIPSGANAGQTAWVAANTGGGNAIVSTPSYPYYVPPTLNGAIGSVTPGVFSNGDAYVIEDLPKVYLGRSLVNADYTSGSFGSIAFQDLDFQGIDQPGGNPGNALPPLGDALINFIACRFSARAFVTPLSTSVTYLNCCFMKGGHFNTAPMFDSGLALLTGGDLFRLFAGGAFDGDFMVYGGPLKLRGFGVDIGTACVFASPSDGVIVGEGGFSTPLTCLSVRDMTHGEHALWGGSNAGVGIRTGVGSQVGYQTSIPSITGTSGDFLAGDKTTARAWDETAGAYTVAKACTWANLALAIASGGLGGSCHDVQGNAHVLGGVL